MKKKEIHQPAQVFARFTFEGIHCWPQAPDKVRFLRVPHRHVFHVEMIKHVEHDDRDVEFIMLAWAGKQYIQAQFPDYNVQDPGLLELGAASCEQLARMLVNYFDLAWCSVSEDGENGAIVDAVPF